MKVYKSPLIDRGSIFAIITSIFVGFLMYLGTETIEVSLFFLLITLLLYLSDVLRRIEIKYDENVLEVRKLLTGKIYSYKLDSVIVNYERGFKSHTRFKVHINSAEVEYFHFPYTDLGVQIEEEINEIQESNGYKDQYEY